MKYVTSVLLLTLTYGLAVSSYQWQDLLVGGLLAVTMTVALRDLVFTESASPVGRFVSRVAAFPGYAASIFVEVTKGIWRVSLIVLGIDRKSRPGIVWIPIGERTPLGVAVTGLAMTLSPGSYLLDVDEEAQRMYFRVVDAADPQAVRDFFRDHYERFQKPVFP